MATGDHGGVDVRVARSAVDLTDADAIDRERRRHWLLVLLGPAAAVVAGMALLSQFSIIAGAVPIQLLVAAVLALSWFLAFRGHLQAAYLCIAVTMPVALVIRPLLTGNANDNILYAGAVGLLLLVLAPARWAGASIAVSLGTATLLLFGTNDAQTPDLGWTALVVNGVVVGVATALLGVLTLRGTHRAMLGAYAARDHSRQLADDLSDATAGLEQAVEDRTAHLRSVLAESDMMIRQLAAAANHDHLTGLPNRRYLRQELPRQVAAAAAGRQPLAVLLIDLVNFKAVNDRYTHDVGDQVLALAASRLASALAPGDTICRLGGDEFVVLTSQVSGEAMAALIAAMSDALTTAHVADAPDLSLGLAVGVATFTGPPDAEPDGTATELLREAEADLRRRRGSEPGTDT